MLGCALAGAGGGASFCGRRAGKWRQNHHKVFVTLTRGGCWPRTTTGIL